MKRISMFAFALLFVTANAFAVNDRVGKVELKLDAASVNNDVAALDDNTAGGGGFSVGVLPQVALAVDGAFHTGAVTNETGVDYYSGVIYGEVILRAPLDQWPMNLWVKEPGIMDAFVPYLLFGWGQNITGLTRVRNTNGSSSGENHVDNADASIFGLGFDWFANKNLAFFFEYDWHSAGSLSMPNHTLNGSELSFQAATGGLKIVF